jgi:hypothetical protein
MRRSLAPGGVLLVQDLFQDAGAWDRVLGGVALVASLGRRARASAETRAAWAEHASSDRFLTLPEVRQRAAVVLPGARVRRHLRWRYSLVWRKP